ncbi:hypothetical protein BGZ96_005288 [Linnemannia gamsii]|uniref:Uncharacterized protein n=1 Tax=Linnemannia gamsii TaxID=64522 RepID=A0ABQ7JHF6_9FUNG|nr:hypothetical protein BGZ96_005288 [Linnemannia gamsii]
MGFIGAYKQDPKLVTKFVTFFVIGSIVWAVLEIIEMAIQVSAYSNLCGYYYYACGFNWAVWIVIFLLGLGFQYYFACCLVSYQRDLLAKLNGDVDGNRAVEMV